MREEDESAKANTATNPIENNNNKKFNNPNSQNYQFYNSKRRSTPRNYHPSDEAMFSQILNNNNENPNNYYYNYSEPKIERFDVHKPVTLNITHKEATSLKDLLEKKN